MRSIWKRVGSHRTLKRQGRPSGWQQPLQGAEVSRGHSSQTLACNGLAWIIHEPLNYWLSFPWQRESRLGNFYQGEFPPTRE